MQSDNDSMLTEGRLVMTLNGTKDAAALPWNAHPTFPGVSLKHLVTGADTGGAISCHLVRLEPGCQLKSHVHEGQWELHEVVAGSGTAGLDGRTADYLPGVMVVIPKGKSHHVTAGDGGLCLFAKFFPALV
jgi:quercetin dioxygenase-like cupin family protein